LDQRLRLILIWLRRLAIWLSTTSHRETLMPPVVRKPTIVMRKMKKAWAVDVDNVFNVPSSELAYFPQS